MFYFSFFLFLVLLSLNGYEQWQNVVLTKEEGVANWDSSVKIGVSQQIIKCSVWSFVCKLLVVKELDLRNHMVEWNTLKSYTEKSHYETSHWVFNATFIFPWPFFIISSYPYILADNSIDIASDMTLLQWKWWQPILEKFEKR